MRTSIANAPGANHNIEFMTGEEVHAGIDARKKDYKVHLWSERRQNCVAAWVQPAEPPMLVKSLEPVKGHIARIVCEAAPTGCALCRQLREAGFTADVIAPSRAPKSASQTAKTDRLDARKLAMYSAKKLLRPVEVPSVEEEADRQVVRMREGMMRKLRRVKQQIKSLLLQHVLSRPQEGRGGWSRKRIAELKTMQLSPQLRLSLDLLLDELGHLQNALPQAVRALRSLAAQERHRARETALETTPGAGPVTAMVFRAELIHFERFNDPRELTAMLGLAPPAARKLSRPWRDASELSFGAWISPAVIINPNP